MDFKKLFERGKQLVLVDIWRFRREQFGTRLFFLVRVARVVILAVKKYMADDCKDKASALTLYSILSIVPLAAMAFGIAKAFSFDTVLADFIYDSFEGHEVVAGYILDFADTYLKNIKGGLVAGIGFAMLLWSVMNLIGHTEKAFNKIWETKKSRSLVRKFSDYISIVLITIIAVTAFYSLVVKITNMFADSVVLSTIWYLLLSVLPCLLMWLGLAAVYYIMPTTKVKFTSALLGGVIAGTILMATQFVYLYFQIGMSKNNAIYGSFAAIPLFIIWLQLTWHIVMIGCEIAYASQNADTYDYESDTSHFSVALRKKIMLYILSFIAKQFDKCQPAPDANRISVELKLPLQLVNKMLTALSDAHIISEVVSTNQSATGFQPAFDIQKLTLGKAFEMVENEGVLDYSIETDDFKRISELMDKVTAASLSESGEILLKDI